MARQQRIAGTESPTGKPIPKDLVEKIVALKKATDRRKKAKEKENIAASTALQAATDAGYKAGDVIDLEDESPPLVFELKLGDPKPKVRVAGRPKRDEIGDDSAEDEE